MAINDIVDGVVDQLTHPFPHKIADDLFSIAHEGGWSDKKNGKKSGKTGCSATNLQACTQCEIAAAVALAESSGKIDAENTNTNGSKDYGLWQVNSVHKFNAEKLKSDPIYNAKSAHSVYSTQGWGAWTQWRNGAYKSFLGQNPTVSLGNATGVDAVTQTADKANPLDMLSGLIATIQSREFWTRFGKIILGGLLTVAAVLILASEFMSKVPSPIKAIA
jgi:hypothetical protein